MFKKFFLSNNIYEAAPAVPFLLLYGVPALLILCVLSGVVIFIRLLAKALKERKAEKCGSHLEED